MDQSLNYRTPMFLDDILKATEGDEGKLRTELFKKFEKLQAGRYETSRKKIQYLLEKKQHGLDTKKMNSTESNLGSHTTEKA